MPGQVDLSQLLIFFSAVRICYFLHQSAALGPQCLRALHCAQTLPCLQPLHVHGALKYCELSRLLSARSACEPCRLLKLLSACKPWIVPSALISCKLCISQASPASLWRALHLTGTARSAV